MIGRLESIREPSRVGAPAGSTFPTGGLLRASNGPPQATCGKRCNGTAVEGQEGWKELACGEFRWKAGVCTEG